MRTSMADEKLIELHERLDILIALTLCQLEKRTDPADIINVLGRFGTEPREIATLLGMTSNAVRVARHRSRKSIRPRPKQVRKKR